MSSILKALWHMQGGDCFYCGRATWLQSSGESMRSAKARLGVKKASQVHKRQASREHLLRRVDGGSDRLDNLVMSCVECNNNRRATPVLLHLAEMRSPGKQVMLDE